MSVLLQITSGRGPVECCWVVAKLAETILSDARNYGCYAEIIEEENGPESGTLQSALIHLSGDNVELFTDRYEGTIQWIGNSTFRPDHKRKNWFVGVSRLPLPTAISFNEQDIRIETMKGSGPGGQHVNTTESAVRAVHLPTGLATIARDERSQTANRKVAMERLSIIFSRHKQREQEKGKKHRWNTHNILIRGNAVRVYVGKEFKERHN